MFELKYIILRCFKFVNFLTLRYGQIYIYCKLFESYCTCTFSMTNASEQTQPIYDLIYV